MKTVFALIVLLTAHPCAADEVDDAIANRPAFSRGDLPAPSTATCHQVRAMAEGLGSPDARLDLSVIGNLTSITTDGALWYLTVCNLPNVRIMCIAYQSNGMRTGDTVFIKGGYRHIDSHHILLDPCLASRPDADAPVEPDAAK